MVYGIGMFLARARFCTQFAKKKKTTNIVLFDDCSTNKICFVIQVFPCGNFLKISTYKLLCDVLVGVLCFSFSLSFALPIAFGCNVRKRSFFFRYLTSPFFLFFYSRLTHSISFAMPEICLIMFIYVITHTNIVRAY